MKLIPRIFLRPKEIGYSRWKYIDFDKQLISIPDAEMKKGREHLVPLAKQVVEELPYIQKMTGYSQFVFPGAVDQLVQRCPVLIDHYIVYLSHNATDLGVNLGHKEANMHGVKTIKLNSQ